MSLSIFMSSPVMAGEKHYETKDCTCLFCVCNQCKCEASPRKKPTCCNTKSQCDKPTKVALPVRRWVEDVNQPGLWYYGYYAPDGADWVFKYSRREYKGGLSNFRSLYSVQYKYDVKTSSKPSVRVEYEYPY